MKSFKAISEAATSKVRSAGRWIRAKIAVAKSRRDGKIERKKPASALAIGTPMDVHHEEYTLEADADGNLRLVAKAPGQVGGDE